MRRVRTSQFLITWSCSPCVMPIGLCILWGRVCVCVRVRACVFVRVSMSIKRLQKFVVWILLCTKIRKRQIQIIDTIEAQRLVGRNNRAKVVLLTSDSLSQLCYVTADQVAVLRSDFWVSKCSVYQFLRTTHAPHGQGHELFCCRGVDRNAGVQVALRGAHLHGHCEPLYHFVTRHALL